MPIYEYRCPKCNRVLDSMQRHIVPTCHFCNRPMKRVFAFSITPPLVSDTHFNNAVGTVVTNTRSFRDELKRKSDEQSARLGLDVNLQPVDYRDAQGVTDEGKYEREKRIHDSHTN